jgi:hypothetical protein
MAEKSSPENEAAAKQLAAEQEYSNKSKAEFAEKTKGKPTPTQEENDLAALGAHFAEHEADGSDPDPNVAKQSEPAKPSGGGYQTRQATPAARHTSHSSHSSG